MAVQKQDGLHTDVACVGLDLTGQEFHFCKRQGDGTSRSAATARSWPGVISEGKKAGYHTSFNLKGNPILKVVAASAIGRGQQVQSATGGKAKAGNTNPVRPGAQQRGGERDGRDRAVLTKAAGSDRRADLLGREQGRCRILIPRTCGAARKVNDIAGEMRVDQYLTNFSVSYRQDQANFVAGFASTPIPVMNESDKYAIYPAGYFWRDEAEVRPLGGRPVQVGYRSRTAPTSPRNGARAHHRRPPAPQRRRAVQPRRGGT
jgi:hypothetical protein